MAGGIEVELKFLGKEKLMQQVESFAINLSRNIAQEVRDAMLEKAKIVLGDYYNAYDPEYYHRTSQLYRSSVQGYYHSPHGTISKGGIDFHPENLSYPPKHKFSGEQVIEQFFEGFHGWRGGENGWEQIRTESDYAYREALEDYLQELVSDICDGERGRRLIAASWNI